MATVRKRKWKTASGELRAGWFVDFYDAQNTRARKLFDTKREADDFRISIENELKGGTFRPDAAKVTVKQAAELFLKHCEVRMERRERMTRRNFQTYEGYVRNYICPDPDWHAKKHASASHQFNYFNKASATKPWFSLVSALSPNSVMICARQGYPSPPPAKSLPCCK